MTLYVKFSTTIKPTIVVNVLLFGVNTSKWLNL